MSHINLRKFVLFYQIRPFIARTASKQTVRNRNRRCLSTLWVIFFISLICFCVKVSFWFIITDGYHTNTSLTSRQIPNEDISGYTTDTALIGVTFQPYSFPIAPSQIPYYPSLHSLFSISHSTNTRIMHDRNQVIIIIYRIIYFEFIIQVKNL